MSDTAKDRYPLSNVAAPIDAMVSGISSSSGAPYEAVIEFRVPRSIAERTRLGDTWILSRLETPDV